MANAPFGSGQYVTIADLSPGDIIWANVFVHIDDLVNRNSNSSTALAVRGNRSHGRYCIVLQKGDTFVDVAYFTTFNYQTAFPAALARRLNFWYPVQPAWQESFPYHPLPALSGFAQWVSLRRKHRIIGNNGWFQKFPVSAPPTATTLYWAMLDTPH
ncbi:hypothetical protein PAXINDRAFT_13967 [Paxillus involutus ATCC 200175]|uniref:Uncharacterized protein n=1 Tax=Paxillus involutus ATCC 200175 TaxID=664439 RepID=A0A0C9U0E9_PAXIN|nr:hypothetical protein PAXINDRAFT_13967 [Paxillus involutus ATCC 200175]